jgi:hypothetical protein
LPGWTSPFNVFAKGFVGGGVIPGGTLVDEDWGSGIGTGGTDPESYSNTHSSLSGSFSYLTADIGYNLLRGPDHKVGAFVGYNRYQISVDALGCSQNVPGAGTCTPTISTNTYVISETDTWHSLRTGVAAETRIADRLRLGADVAYLPYVWVQALDTHHVRSLYFPVEGIGSGRAGRALPDLPGDRGAQHRHRRALLGDVDHQRLPDRQCRQRLHHQHRALRPSGTGLLEVRPALIAT